MVAIEQVRKQGQLSLNQFSIKQRCNELSHHSINIHFFLLRSVGPCDQISK